MLMCLHFVVLLCLYFAMDMFCYVHVSVCSCLCYV